MIKPKLYLDVPPLDDWIKSHGQLEDLKAHEIASEIHKSKINANSGDGQAGATPAINLPKGRS